MGSHLGYVVINLPMVKSLVGTSPTDRVVVGPLPNKWPNFMAYKSGGDPNYLRVLG